MKKGLLLLLSLLLLLPYSIWSEGVKKDNEENVLELKKKFNITEDYEDFTISESEIGERTGNTYLDRLAKQTRIKGYHWNDENLGFLEISMDQEGNILTYSKYNFKEKPKGKKNFVKKDIGNNVEEFLKKVDPTLLDQYELKDFKSHIKEGRAHLTYLRKINEIPFVQDRILVDYDLTKDRVTDYNRGEYDFAPLATLKDKDFPKDQGISMEKAQEIFVEEQPLELFYLPLEEKALPVYTRKEFKDINAGTGKLQSMYRGLVGFDGSMDKAVAEEASNLTPVEKDEISAVKGLKSKSEATKYAQKLVPKDFTVSEFLTTKLDEEYYYILNYSSKDKKNMDFASVTLNGKTFELKNFYVDQEIDQKKKISEEEMKKVAQEFIQHYVKDTEELALDQMEIHPRRDNTLYVPRKVNGIEVLGEGLYLTIDGGNKKVSQFDRQISSLTFPAITDVISSKEAHKFLFDSTFFVKKYTLTEKGIDLVYGLEDRNNFYIDAFQKEWIDRGGRTLRVKSTIKIPSLNQSKYQKEISLLADMGIGLDGKNLDEALRYDEMMTLFQQIEGGNQYFPEDMAYLYDRLELKNDKELKDQKVSRGRMVKALLQFFEYEELYQLDGIFRNDLFTDQKSMGDDEKTMILGKGLQIVTEKEGRAKDPVTLEEALIYLYRSLQS